MRDEIGLMPIVYSLNDLRLVEVKMRCLKCKQTMTGMIELPQSDASMGEITINLRWCPFDTEEGRKDLVKGLSLADARLKREQKI